MTQLNRRTVEENRNAFQRKLNQTLDTAERWRLTALIELFDQQLDDMEEDATYQVAAARAICRRNALSS